MVFNTNKHNTKKIQTNIKKINKFELSHLFNFILLVSNRWAEFQLI